MTVYQHTTSALPFVKPCDARHFYFFQRKVKQIKFSWRTADLLTGTNCLKRIHLTVGKINQSGDSYSASPARSQGLRKQRKCNTLRLPTGSPWTGNFPRTEVFLVHLGTPPSLFMYLALCFKLNKASGNYLRNLIKV